MSQISFIAAIVQAITPYRLAALKADALAADVVAKLNEDSGYNKRSILEKSGWAIPQGDKKSKIELVISWLNALESGP